MKNIQFDPNKFPNDGNIYLLMVRSYGFLGKAIRFFMWVKAIILRRPDKRHLFNHSDLIIGDNLVCGAYGRGVQVKSVGRTYDDGCDRDILVYRLPLNAVQTALLRNWCLNQSGKPYEYSNMLNHIKEIFSDLWRNIKGKSGEENWKGHTGVRAQKRYFCVELSATAINQVMPGFAKEPWGIDPMELVKLADENFSVVKMISIRN